MISIRDIPHIIKMMFNKRHLKTIWSAITASPDNFYCTMEIMYNRLAELEHYYVERYDCFNWCRAEYNDMMRQIRLAIKLNRIIYRDGDNLYDVGLFRDFDKPLQDRYKCIVKVNLKNAARFVKPKYIPFYTSFPHELYLVKARHLYHKILAKYAFEWI